MRIGKRLPLISAMLLLTWSSYYLYSDVIYLKNGTVLVVSRAWEDSDVVHYETRSGSQTLPKSSVKRIQSQQAQPADPSRNEPVTAAVIRGTPVTNTQSPKSESSPASSVRERARSSKYKDAAGYEEAIRMQQSSGKPVALYFYADWCGYCAKLEKGILSDPEVRQHLDSILYVSVNPEHGAAEQKLFRRFDGLGFPTFLILKKDRTATAIHTSGTPQSFLDDCKRASQ